jgi:hypothetical protein
MLSQIGSSKVRNASKRIAIENKFLGSLSVQCDDSSLIDQVIGDDGEVKPFQQVMEVVTNNPDTVRFFKGGVIGLDVVKASLVVIANCNATIKRFNNR